MAALEGLATVWARSQVSSEMDVSNSAKGGAAPRPSLFLRSGAPRVRRTSARSTLPTICSGCKEPLKPGCFAHQEVDLRHDPPQGATMPTRVTALSAFSPSRALLIPAPRPPLSRRHWDPCSASRPKDSPQQTQGADGGAVPATHPGGDFLLASCMARNVLRAVQAGAASGSGCQSSQAPGGGCLVQIRCRQGSLILKQFWPGAGEVWQVLLRGDTFRQTACPAHTESAQV